MLLLFAALAAPASGPSRVADLAALYDEVCLKAFPSDTEVDALMARKGAKPLTADEVKVTLRDDPGRGWRIDQGDYSILIFLELPPFHACSVRGPVGSSPIDLAPYLTKVGAFKAANPGFKAEKAMDAEQGGIHMHAEYESRPVPGGASELLMVIDQHVADPARRAKGETGAMLRFVHQIKGSN